MRLNLSRIHYPVTTLGPGRRIGVWLQGCSIRCAGCISLDTWAAGKGATSVEAVLEALAPWFGEAEGLTVSGGEPFDQTDALHALLRGVRRSFPGDVLVYSGHSVEALSPGLGRFAGLIDALVSDPFDAGAGQTLPLRGSDNQRLHLLTDLGRIRFAEIAAGRAPERAVDLVMDEDGTVWMAGIPKPGDLRRLERILAAAGFDAGVTEVKMESRP